MYPQVFGKYVLERELSRGGMARVVLATLRGAGGFEKKLVVKQIRDELAFDNQFVRRFVEEAKTTVALSHPNIVPVYELGVEQGTYFLAMELVEGLSVAELLRDRNEDGSRRVLTPEEGAYVGVEVCRALDYAHRRMKVVHRDITPRNVMIDEEGQVKLIDFGIAAPALVAGHEILGSPGHMAPEQIDGGELGPPTDIFAVAVLLMEAWTGAAPFRRATPEECAAAVREAHPRPSDFDPRLLPLDDAILSAMDVDPKKRQQDADELGRALRSFLQSIDTADLARGLGDRVRDLREEVDSPSPPSRTTAPRASAASHGDLGTKTFAARDDSSWSQPPAAAAPAAMTADEEDEKYGVPSTRKLSSNESSSKLPAVRVNRGKANDPAMSIPTPLMVEVDELQKIHRDIDAARAEKQTPLANEVKASDAKDSTANAIAREAREAKAREREQRRGDLDAPTVRRPKFLKDDQAPVETIATRPFETPVRAFERQTPPQSSRSRSIMMTALFAVLVLTGVVVWRMRAKIETDPDANLPVVANPTATGNTSADSSAGEPSTTNRITPPTNGTAKTTAPPTNTQPPNPSTSSMFPALSASGPAAAGKAAVILLGEPGTRVSVDGAARGACPARVELPPGTHTVQFTFDPTGESRGEKLTVKGGDRVTVRAEFTGATPTVKIQR